MQQCDPGIVKGNRVEPADGFDRFLRWFAFFTMLMTIPQVVTVWRDGAGGVSLTSWVTYLASSVAWLVYGLRKHDTTLWLVCIGWIIVDGAIVAGILAHK